MAESQATPELPKVQTIPELRISQEPGKTNYFESLMLTALFYPIERIQTNYQLKSTYINQEIRQCKQFFTRCTHYGFISWFRGFNAYMLRMMSTYAAYHGSLLLSRSEDERVREYTNPSSYNAVPYVFLGIGYSLVYPLENIRVRMGADVERLKVYAGTRDCADKMRKIEGVKSFYRGFALALPHLMLQYGLTTHLYCELVGNTSAAKKLREFSPIFDSSTGVPQFLIAYTVSQLALYPFDTLKKIVQMNGALNHSNHAPRYRDALQLNSLSSFYRGIHMRFLNGLLYFGGAMLMNNSYTPEE